MAKAKTKVKAKPRKRASQPSMSDHYPEGDARTLAEANAIKADSGRLGRAQKATAKLVKEQQQQLDGMKKILKGL